MRIKIADLRQKTCKRENMNYYLKYQLSVTVGSLEQNYLFVWDSCFLKQIDQKKKSVLWADMSDYFLTWFMGVNKNIVHSKSRFPRT